MDREEFLNNEDVVNFIAWAGEILPTIEVNLNISRRGTGRVNGELGPGVEGQYFGIDQIVNVYQWRGKWSGPDGSVQSCDWHSTRESLNQLSVWLRETVETGTDDEIINCISAVLKWGGDRNPKVGATPFFTALPNLREYLVNAQEVFTLAGADTENVDGIGEMNSMITKVHALASEDGLPIYDSRVAAAIGCLVEIYRRVMNPTWNQLPEVLAFKAVDDSPRRRVMGLTAAVGVLEPNMFMDPGRITRGTTINARATRAREWSSSKIRLGWLLEAIVDSYDLFEAETLANDSLQSRLHAFEASLFMIGFDVSCLQANI